MKKILFITPFPPSTIGAGVNYTRQFLEDISKSFKVDLIYFRSKDDIIYLPLNQNISVKYIFVTTKIRKFLSALIIPFLFPLFTAKFSFIKLYKIKKLLKYKEYDFIYFDFSQMFLYGRFLKGRKTIFMAHDIIGQRYERRSWLLGKWAKLSEGWILKKCNQIFTFSFKDSNLINKWYGKPSIVTPFYFEKNVEDAAPDKIGEYFVFFAMWKRPDNYNGLKWFITHVLPNVGDIKFKIIGSGLPQDIKAAILNNKNVEYLGFVDNPYPIIANSRALISPLFQGAGVKVKVLDALAVGAPIIGTEISFEGIDDIYGSLMYRADTVDEFIEKIKKIDISPETRQALKRQFIERNKTKEIIKYLQSK